MTGKEKEGRAGGRPNTPYDDAFRLMAMRGGKWFVAFLNEVFRLNPPLPVDSAVGHEADELFRKSEDGGDGKVIADSVVRVGGGRFHVECQSGDDSSILIRMFEYDFDVALRHASRGAETVEFPLPYSAVLYLRVTDRTPRRLTVRMTDPEGGRLDHRVEVMWLKDYSLDELLDRDLVFLFPFLMFNYEDEIRAERPAGPAAALDMLLRHVNTMYEERRMSEEHYVLVTDMLQKVTDALAVSRPRVRKELDRIMNGQILADPIEELLEQGRAEGLSAGRAEGLSAGRAEGLSAGRAEGLSAGRAEGRAEGVGVLLSLVHDGLLDVGVAASKAEQAYGMPPEEFRKRLAAYGPASDSAQGD